MIGSILERRRQGYRTIDFPEGPAPVLPPRFRGLPILDHSLCVEGCSSCVSSCPTEAISMVDNRPVVDLGRCLFCGDCTSSCPDGAFKFSNDFRLATDLRDNLRYSGLELKLAAKLEQRMLSLFGRSLKLRQVSAAGCNGCEVEVNVLGTVVFDLGRFGIQYVASPRHADGLLVTGTVSENMREALLKTYEAVPDPKIVIAVGACAISGGPYRDNPEIHNGVGSLLPVDLYIPGCPPHPLTILDGMLRLLGRIESGAERKPTNSADDTVQL